MWATKNPLRAPTYFCNPRSPLCCRSATSCFALRSIVFLQLPLTAPLHNTRFLAVYAPRSALTMKFGISRTNGGQSNQGIYR